MYQVLRENRLRAMRARCCTELIAVHHEIGSVAVGIGALLTQVVVEVSRSSTFLCLKITKYNVSNRMVT